MRVRTLAAIITLIVVVAFAMVGVMSAASAISNRRAIAAGYIPASYGPTIDGQCYYGYRYDPIEAVVAGSTCTPYLYPANPPIPSMVDYAVANVMWRFFLGNDTWINGPSHYDRILLPASRRTSTIIVSRNTYIDSGNQFNLRYKADHDRWAKTYPPTFKKANDKSAHPKVFKGDAFASKSNRAADLTKAQTAKRNNGGNAGTVTDPAKARNNPATKTTVKSGNSGSDSARDPARTTTRTTTKSNTSTGRSTGGRK